jgi:hypothetical protein
MLFDGEDFILQMHRVFTRIRSGDPLVAKVAARVDLQTAAQQQWHGWPILG